MVTLAKSRKGMGGEKQERKGKKVLARPLSPARKLQGENFPFLYSWFFMPVSLINGNREMKISST